MVGIGVIIKCILYTKVAGSILVCLSVGMFKNGRLIVPQFTKKFSNGS